MAFGKYWADFRGRETIIAAMGWNEWGRVVMVVDDEERWDAHPAAFHPRRGPVC